MAVEVFLPKTGIYIDDVTLLEWLQPEGARVEEGDAVLLMETEKVEVEVPAEGSGWLHQSVQPGSTLPIGTVVGWIAETQDEYTSLSAAPGAS